MNERRGRSSFDIEGRTADAVLDVTPRFNFSVPISREVTVKELSQLIQAGVASEYEVQIFPDRYGGFLELIKKPKWWQISWLSLEHYINNPRIQINPEPQHERTPLRVSVTVFGPMGATDFSYNSGLFMTAKPGRQQLDHILETLGKL